MLLAAGALAAAIGVAVPGAAVAQEVRYRARLSTVPISPADRATVTGLGEATATLNGRALTVTGMFDGLQGPATTAALHMGPVTGVRGPMIHTLEVSASSEGALTGTVNLSRGEARALEEGRIYIQLHSEAAPEGNLWGWLLE